MVSLFFCLVFEKATVKGHRSLGGIHNEEYIMEKGYGNFLNYFFYFESDKLTKVILVKKKKRQFTSTGYYCFTK